MQKCVCVCVFERLCIERCMDMLSGNLYGNVCGRSHHLGVMWGGGDPRNAQQHVGRSSADGEVSKIRKLMEIRGRTDGDAWAL